jgi:hypothetical protein
MPPDQSPTSIDAMLRREGFLVGAAVGAALAGGAEPAGRRRAGLALGEELLVELASGGVDLHRLAGRWLAWRRADGFEADASLKLALDCLEQHDAPPDELPAPDPAALAAALPAAVANASPRAMLSGGFHVARMLDPDPATGLSAVALIVAAAALLEGRRDFIGDVLSAMRANDAPPDVFEALRAIPRDPARPVSHPAGSSPDPMALTTWTLWQAYHRQRTVEVLADLRAGQASPIAGALLGALLGARDGVGAWSHEWLELDGPAVARRQEFARQIGH